MEGAILSHYNSYLLKFTYNDTVFSYVDIRSNLGGIDNTILLNNYMVSNMKWKKCNPTTQ